MTGPPSKERYWVARKFYESLMVSERVTPQRILDYQDSQLQQLLAHTAQHVPFYRDILSSIRLSNGQFDLSRWLEMPVVSREIVSKDWDRFQSTYLPEGHRSVLQSTTSGSEGPALKMRKTRFEHTGVACASYRYAQWFSYDYKIPLAMIRAGFIRSADPDDPEDRLWGPPWIPSEQRGARYRLDVNEPLTQQFEWLCQLGHVYLNTLPSNAMALAHLAAKSNQKPSLAGILTVGERLSSDVRKEVGRILGCRISDVYATAECGLIAIECPDTSQYHIQSEISKVEVLKDNGLSCSPGETGQLVATSLYNYAMPIIRYRFNDLVTMGGPCSCGRALPVISKIIGRKKGLFHLPDGSKILPEFCTRRFNELAGTVYWQVAQTARDRVEIRLKDSPKMIRGRADAIARYVCDTLTTKVEIKVSNVTDFARSKGGKFYPVVREFN